MIEHKSAASAAGAVNGIICRGSDIMVLTVLNQLMAERAITKSKLAQYSGIPYTTIDGWYKKGYGNVRLATLLKLSDYFNVSLVYLVRRYDDDNRIGLTEIQMMEY